jgi:hypothetical protein
MFCHLLSYEEAQANYSTTVSRGLSQPHKDHESQQTGTETTPKNRVAPNYLQKQGFVSD